MTIDHTGVPADSSATACGRASRVRRVVLGCLLAAAGMTAAQAQDGWHRGDDGRAAQQRDERAQRQYAPREQRFDPRSFDSRRAEDERRQQQAQQDQSMRNGENYPRRGARMTPDERRDLRRQINEAGVDLYPNTPRR